MIILILNILFLQKSYAQNVKNFEGNPTYINLISSLKKQIDKTNALDSGCFEKKRLKLVRIDGSLEELDKKYWAEETAHLKKHPEIKDLTKTENLSPRMIEIRKEQQSLLANRQEANDEYYDCQVDFFKKFKIEEFFDVFAEPNEKSEKLGKIYIRYMTELVYRDGDSTAPEKMWIRYIDTKERDTDFKPDLVTKEVDHTDAVERYFHTVLARQGVWLKLPKNPFPKPAWIKAKEPNNMIKEIRKNQLLGLDTKTYKGNLVFQQVKDGLLIGHTDTSPTLNPDATSEDDACTPSKIPPKPIKIPVQELFDSEQHLHLEFVPDAPCGLM